MPQRLKTDWILFGTVLVMLSFGLLMIYSASSVNAATKAATAAVINPEFGSSWPFVLRQLGWAVVALIAMMTLKNTNYRRFQHPAVAFGAIGIALLLLLAVYFADPRHHRWLRVGGQMGVQPSELAKPALVIFLAFFVTWRARAINNPRYTLIPAAVAVGAVMFAVVVPDLGTAAVLGAAAMVVFFVAGLEWRYCFIVAGIAALGVVVAIAVAPYRAGRVVRFVDPDFKKISLIDRKGVIKAWIERSHGTRDTNYQAEQSVIAVGAGGPTGLGLMNGRQKLLYLPEAHTDFIYAVVGEEVGLIGSFGLLLGFGIIFWRGLRATLRIQDEFGRYLALGVTVVVVVQAMVNMSVVLGMGPTKGIPLPLISYGGSSLLSTLALLGMLMNVSEHAG
jgi:cell division protein FtsW